MYRFYVGSDEVWEFVDGFHHIALASKKWDGEAVWEVSDGLEPTYPMEFLDAFEYAERWYDDINGEIAEMGRDL